MKRVTQGGDINFNVADVRGLGENYAFRFYTTDNSKYIVKVDGDAVDGIIRLEWDELKTLGDGVLNYSGENLEPDEEYSDATFNRTFGGTTQWYIVTSNGGSGTSEEITELSDRLDAEIERSTGKDNEHDTEISGLNETVQTIQTNTYTKDEVYTQQEVNDLIGEGIVSIDTIEQSETSTESGGKNVLTITKTDGTSSTFEVYNGAKGDTGSYTVTDGVVTVTVINDLETDDPIAALSAAQGKKLNDNLSDLENTVNGTIQITDLSATSGKYIYSDGRVFGGAAYSYTEPYDVKEGDLVKVTAALGPNKCVIAKVNTVDVSYTKVEEGRDESQMITYEWEATEDCQLATSFNTSRGYTIVIERNSMSKDISDIKESVAANSAAIADMYTKQEVDEAISSAIEDMPTGDIPTKLSDLENDDFYVQDENYVHTDNNFTTADKTAIQENTTKINSLEIESGTFAEAYDKSKSNNQIFQWLMVDEDNDGNAITKIIWHKGNNEFIDAIGADIKGKKNGITVTSDGEGTLKIIGGGYEAFVQNGSAEPIGVPAVLSFSAGETNFSYEDIANALKNANSQVYETAINYTGTNTTYLNIYNTIKNYDGKTLSGNMRFSANIYNQPILIEVDNENPNKATYVDIDMGGVIIKGNTSYFGNANGEGYAYCFWGDNGKSDILRNVQRFKVEGKYVSIFNNCIGLKNAEIQGYCTGGLYAFYGNSNGIPIEKVSLKNFEFRNTCTTLNLLYGNGMNSPITSIDLRNFDTSSVANLGKTFQNCSSLKTIIIGNFSNESLTSDLSQFFYSIHSGVITGATLVCTTDTPPILNTEHDWISGHFTHILVPNKTVEVEGEQVTVLSRYLQATGWSTYTDIMNTYEEGEY